MARLGVTLLTVPPFCPAESSPILFPVTRTHLIRESIRTVSVDSLDTSEEEKNDTAMLSRPLPFSISPFVVSSPD